MTFEDRFTRKRELALIEAQSLFSMHHIPVADLVRLEAELAERRKALAIPIAEAKRLMTAHGISLEEVVDEVLPDPNRITHRHPRTGETWNGLGMQPQWLRSALLEGYRPAELRVSAGEVGAGTS